MLLIKQAWFRDSCSDRKRPIIRNELKSVSSCQSKAIT